MADLKIKNLEIVNKTTNHVDIVSAQAPNFAKYNTVVYKKNIFVCKHLADFGG